MSADIELWTRQAGDISAHLPRRDEWDAFDGDFEFDGGGWLVSVGAPEEAPGEAPAELSALVPKLRYRVAIGVEPSNPDAAAWQLVHELLRSLGSPLGGAAIDPETGHATSYAG